MPESRPETVEAGLKLLGLARRAGAVAPGVDAARRAVRDGSAKLLVVGADASPTQLEKVVPAAERDGVPVRVLGDRDALGHALGRSPLTAVAVTDAGLAEQVLRRLPGPSGARDKSK